MYYQHIQQHKQLNTDHWQSQYIKVLMRASKAGQRIERSVAAVYFRCIHIAKTRSKKISIKLISPNA